MKILDSDHCVAILRGKLDLTKHVLVQEELAVTAISVGELSHGACKSARPAKNLARLQVLLSSLTVLPFNDSAALTFGKLKAELEKKDAKLSNLDLQISAIALNEECPLVTHNQLHFERIPELTLADWL